MQYTQKKAELLSVVEFTNLLSFNLVQNKLQRNFKSIVQALLLNESKTDILNQGHQQFKLRHDKQISEMMKDISSIKELLKQQNKPTSQVAIKPQSNQSSNIKSSQNKLKTQHKIPTIIQPPNNSMLQQNKEFVDKWQSDKQYYKEEIQSIKNKLAQMDKLHDQIDGVRGDFKLVKQQLDQFNHRQQLSCINITKRQSVASMAAIKNTSKQLVQASNKQLDQASKLSIQPSKHSIKVLQLENKQNSAYPNQRISQDLDATKNQINSIYLDLNSLKISFEQLKELMSDLKKQSSKNQLQLNQAKSDLEKQIKCRSQQNINMQKVLKQLSMQILNIQIPSKQHEVPNKNPSHKSQVQSSQQNPNFKNQLNDKISRLQSMVKNLPSETQFARLKAQVQDQKEQTERINKRMAQIETAGELWNNNIQNKMKQTQMSNNQNNIHIHNQLRQLQHLITNDAAQNQRKLNINTSKLEQLRTSLQNLRQDMEFYQSMMSQNANKTQKKGVIQISSTQHQKSIPNAVSQKQIQQLKKAFHHKLHQLRSSLLSSMRELQSKSSHPVISPSQIITLHERLSQVQLYLSKKSDLASTQQSFTYLQKKLNRIGAVVFSSQETNEDARIAKWGCLSCDKGLTNYQGKLGKHLVWDTMGFKGKQANIQDKRKGLPVLRR